MDNTNSLMPTLERIEPIATLEPIAKHLESKARQEPTDNSVQPALTDIPDSLLPIDAAAEVASQIDYLVASLADPDPAITTVALQALRELGDAAVPALIMAIDNYHNQARLYAVKALADIGSLQSLDVLIQCAQPDELMLGVRRAAILGLTRINWPYHSPAPIANQQARIFELFSDLCTDPNWSVRYAVVVALANLSKHERHQFNFCMGELLEPLCAQETEPVVKTRANVVLQQYLA
ncbi:HEAT domain containing protein [Thalassoporum mexicanum PCC 7367]|uniref:HEAT repeat domain-containing protein n=1 Tax=Thalassoporum mexicanum TaxID=3457544 RepID=UPI0002A0005B|nr:HEAT repeat domain-containing protein [Pseudanabaena sp. PCC 7367]AFY70647.1 HEAT domain containing protein [Pseudanabaena sp. PCC 7367]